MVRKMKVLIVNLLFSGMNDDSLVEEMRDISQQQGKPAIQNDEYYQVKKVYRKRKLSSGDRILFVLGKSPSQEESMLG